MEAGGLNLQYRLHEHISICYEWLDAVMYSVTADKAKMRMVGGTWDFDNGATVAQYVLDNMDNMETLNKGNIKKEGLNKVECV